MSALLMEFTNVAPTSAALFVRTRILGCHLGRTDSCSWNNSDRNRSLFFGLIASAFVMTRHCGRRRRQKRIEALLDDGVAFA
jgi:hypothetical protein